MFLNGKQVKKYIYNGKLIKLHSIKPHGGGWNTITFNLYILLATGKSRKVTSDL
jgi:hypothetical protein